VECRQLACHYNHNIVFMKGGWAGIGGMTFPKAAGNPAVFFTSGD
jgi:hypothetical protein